MINLSHTHNGASHEIQFANDSVWWFALIAAVIYFGSGSQPVSAASGMQKIAISDAGSSRCARIFGYGRLNVQ